ncbi:hypothetical protein T4B_8197 [Trichinella pseudospiralis]|uniref:Uncharacterized protein n=1 Tax=Trichinella pseudospiralis TaxID=6337 RepID=A0A0V1IIC3_TRIPS|nr:hypothetical protein T4B_8197 [Trichinella pseudospiralis]
MQQKMFIRNCTVKLYVKVLDVLKIESVCSLSANLQMTMRYMKIDVQQCDWQFVQLNRLPAQRLVGCLVGRCDDNSSVI